MDRRTISRTVVLLDRFRLLEVAKSEIGTKETPPNTNRTKYGAWYGLDGHLWCAMFVSWCYARAGRMITELGNPKGFASCQALLDYARRNGLLVKDAALGDIVLYDWNGDGRVEHTGIFVQWHGPMKFTAIEGNTGINNDSNGGEVMMRNRNRKSAYFVRLPNT